MTARSDSTGELLDAQLRRASARAHHSPAQSRQIRGADPCALRKRTSQILVTIDADTSIAARRASASWFAHFADPRVGAVAGNVKVGNRNRWLTRWQALEYITSQNLEKRAFDLLNCIPVVPGASERLARGGHRRPPAASARTPWPKTPT